MHPYHAAGDDLSTRNPLYSRNTSYKSITA
jgi:hypothetical protein